MRSVIMPGERGDLLIRQLGRCAAIDVMNRIEMRGVTMPGERGVLLTRQLEVVEREVQLVEA